MIEYLAQNFFIRRQFYKKRLLQNITLSIKHRASIVDRNWSICKYEVSVGFKWSRDLQNPSSRGFMHAEMHEILDRQSQIRSPCSNHSHRKRRTHSTPPTSPDPVALRIKQRLDSKGAGGWGRGGGEERRKSLRFHSRFTPLSFHSGFLPPFVAFFIFQNTAQYSKTFSYSPTLPSTRHLRNPSSRLLYSQVPTPTPPKRKS